MTYDTEQYVEDVMKYVHDFHEANDEWPTRKEYAEFLGLENARAIPGVRAAINRKLIGYLWPHDRMAPRDVADAQYAAWAAEHNTGKSHD